MVKITDITKIELRTDTKNRPYYRTHAILADGGTAIGFGKDFIIGEDVTVFHDDRYNVIKMVKKLP